MSEASLQNSLQSAAKGNAQNVPQRKVFEYLAARPGEAVDCNIVATHFNVIGYAKDKIAKDLSSIYLAHRGEFERDVSMFPYSYTYKGNGTVAPSKTGERAELFLAQRVMEFLKKNRNVYFSPVELGTAMGIDEKKIAGALSTAFHTKAGKSNGLIRIANGKSFKYAVDRKRVLPATQPMGKAPDADAAMVAAMQSVPLTHIAGLASLIAEVITLDEKTRNVALKIGKMMAGLPPVVQADFLGWAELFEGGK